MVSTIDLNVVSSTDLLTSALQTQRIFFRENPYPELRERKKRLKKLKQLVHGNIDNFCAALEEDFKGRNHYETKVLECFPCLQAINFALKNLKSWMSTEHRSTPLWYQPASNYIRYQPLGIAGIIVPWNCPLYLSITPMVSAIAAGNSVMIKLPEQTPVFSNLLAKLINNNFPKEIAVAFNGGVELSKAFSKLPLDLLLFTGSTKTGSEVMISAGENLTPVILELGGKSPVIIGEGANLKKAIQNIVASKFANGGQICVCPDHIYIPDKLKEEVTGLFEEAFKSQYVLSDKITMTNVISSKAFSRLKELIDDAVQKGALVKWLTGEKPNEKDGSFPPALVTGIKEDMTIAGEEIFGPVLPIIFYSDFSEVLNKITNNTRPLAVYYFGTDKKQIEDVTKKTHSGALLINDTMLQVLQDDLPFGGVGHSGMGRYHGLDGFKAFSNAKSVMKQSSLSLTNIFRPPYTSSFNKKIIDIMLKL